MNVSFPPQMYHWFVRPKWFTKKYIHDRIAVHFHFRDKAVLDFGAGTGANCGMFAPARYIGVEPDSNRVRYARRLYPDHTFEVFDMNRLPVADEAVDYVLIVAVLHHIPSEWIVRYLEEFRRVLKKGGRLIVIEPYLCPKHPICNRFMKWYDNGNFIRPEKGYLSLFADHGYDCSVISRFRKCLLYNELFFTANPQA